MKRHMCLRINILGRTLIGVREYLHSLPKFSFDPDAGPILQGLSASGSAFAIGAATRLWELSMLTSSEIAGNTVYGRG